MKIVDKLVAMIKEPMVPKAKPVNKTELKLSPKQKMYLRRNGKNVDIVV